MCIAVVCECNNSVVGDTGTVYQVPVPSSFGCWRHFPSDVAMPPALADLFSNQVGRVVWSRMVAVRVFAFRRFRSSFFLLEESKFDAGSWKGTFIIIFLITYYTRVSDEKERTATSSLLWLIISIIAATTTT